MAYNPNLYMQSNLPTGYPQQVWPFGVVPVQPFAPSIIGVNGREGANALRVSPNDTVGAFDLNSDIAYVIKADAAGYTTVDEYDLTPRARASAPAPAGYVTREDFDALAEKVAVLEARPSKAKEAKHD